MSNKSELSRRRLLQGCSGIGIATMSGCLRLTDQSQSDSQPQTDKAQRNSQSTIETETDEFTAGLYAFDSESGALSWVHQTNSNERQIRAIATSRNRVFYGIDSFGEGQTEQSPGVRAIDKETKKIAWEQGLDEGSLTGMHHSNGTLLVSRGFETYLFNPQTGIIKETLSIGGGFGGFLSAGEKVYLLNDESGLYDMGTGQFDWRESIERRPTGIPVLKDGTIYYGSDKGYVVAMDAGSGTQLWESRVGGVSWRVAVGEHAVWVVDEASRFYGFSRTDGSELYTRDEGISTSSGAPVAVGEYVYVPITYESDEPAVQRISYTETDGIRLTPAWDGGPSFVRDGQFVSASDNISILDPDGTVTWESERIQDQHSLFPANENTIKFGQDRVFAATKWD